MRSDQPFQQTGYSCLRPHGEAGAPPAPAHCGWPMTGQTAASRE